MSKKSSFIQVLLQPWQALTVLMVVSVLVLGLGVGKLMPTNLLGISSALAQRVSPGDVWQQVYQQLPDLPKENKYNRKDSGKVADNNTLASRLIRYHIYIKGRSPIYRLDWKLTLADYLGVNEIMYDTTYPGNDTLQQNPIAGDRTAIKNLTRQQRNALVQVLVNIFNPSSPNTQVPSPSPSTPSQQPQRGGADLLK
ncbi:hypothetical protein [Halotia branconii]|uniref:Uncharacterized protein n=1 Tax=Halotia branconii CENA392 TaxID=1539056 RepID=A0AAJ6NU48_9CYAN|nr:hypothetical protein [Halotia branconii]WGV26770.1 hypothetical protein QI031_04485 [Halotia branconii CENA392]